MRTMFFHAIACEADHHPWLMPAGTLPMRDLGWPGALRPPLVNFLCLSYKDNMNTIRWTEKAFRQLRKIKDNQTNRRIYQEAQSLAHFPDCPNVKRLKNHTYGYRLRVGDWRVFFEFDGAVKIISIEEVKKRNEHTY